MSRNGPAGKIHLENAFHNGHSTQGANDQSPKIKSLRCIFCSMDKPLDAFSQTQIQKATFNPYAPPSYNKGLKSKQISCKQCTAGVTVSLTCMLCTIKKPLEQFAKVQRKHNEKARCLKCMKKREEEDVDDSDYDSEYDSEDD
ncbi:hypothetical protein BDF14DRAFT_1842565 [Spinellus fusiger]|nr:hypothetical protein BDF14DRAFT_1842565 [Spinellus fusiger]